MNILKKLLAVGGVTALVIGGIVIGGDKEDITLPYTSVIHERADIAIEQANAKPGDEITTMRDRNSKTIKVANGKFSKRIYSSKQHYLDSEDGVYKEYDLSIKDVTPEAKADPKRKWDKYVDPGEDAPKTTWFKDTPWNYTFKDSDGENYISFEALYGVGLVTHELKYNKFGTDLFVIINDKADANDLNNELSWNVHSNEEIVIEQNGSLTISNSDITVNSPWLKDANLKYYYNSIIVTLDNNVLTYALNLPDDIVYPITIDPSTTVQSVLDGMVYTISGQYGDGAGGGAHDTLTAAGVNATQLNVGQTNDFAGSGNFGVWRSHMTFPDISANIGTVSSCSLYLYLQTDMSTTDFNSILVSSKKKGALAVGWFDEFYGWTASGLYSADWLSNAMSSNGIGGAGFKPFAFTAAGLDTVESRSGDSLHVTLLSWEDVSNSEPTAHEYMVFYSSTESGKEPYISYTYSAVIPEGFTVTHIVGESDSLLCEWTCTYDGEDGFMIWQSPYGAGDSIRSDMTADITSMRIGGLNPNALYELKVGIIDSESDSTSAADSCYTLPNTPHTLITTTPNADSSRFYFDVASNPAYTNFAIMRIASPGTALSDTTYLNFTSETMVARTDSSKMITPHADSSYVWGTAADMTKINNEDTLTVAGESGRKYTWKVWALSGSVDKR